MARDHRLLVEPRHAVAADVEPAVDARCRPRQHEQQRSDVQRQVAAVVQPDPGERERGDRPQCARQPGERTELHRPLRRGERQQHQPDRRRTDQSPHRTFGHPRNTAAPQQHGEHAEQTQQQHQHREPPGQRRVDAVFDGEEVVPQEVLVPRDRRPDLVFDAGRLGHRGQRLVPEHDHEDQSQRRQQRGDRREHAVGRPATGDDPGDGRGRRPAVARAR